MKEKKHIDRLFQERFKDFEATPSDAVWKNIEAQLNQKNKKRRVIPIWWSYAGVAALLLLFLTVGGIYFNSNDTVIPSNQVVGTKDTEPSKLDNLNNIDERNEQIDDISGNDDRNTLESIKNNQSVQGQHTSNTPPSSAIANTSSEPSSSNATLSNTGILKTQNSIQAPLIDNNGASIADSEVKDKTESPTALIGDSKNHIEKTNEKNPVLNTNNATTIANTNNKNLDSLPNNAPKNKLLSIEDALAKAKNITEEEKPQDKWSIAPNAAPVYFNSLGRGSSIDSQFNNNSKTGEVNMSYGVIASYAISKNLKIRSGINKVNLGYNTNDVVVFESVGFRSSSSLIKNIAPNYSSENISLVSGESLSDNKNGSFIKTSNTSINQSLGYIEVPLEIEYAIINKKFGVNVIGGFSSFFLNNNKLYSEFNGGRTLIGKATNLNKISYSANFGLGLNYKMTKKFELNLEPLFKYQINTFNNTSGDFKPYFIGVYTGIGFKF